MNAKMRKVFLVALLFTLGRCKNDLNILTKVVHVGDHVTLTCTRQDSLEGTLLWIRFDGNAPEYLGGSHNFNSDHVESIPPFTVKQQPGASVLHITGITLNDTAFYYCNHVHQLTTTFLNVTFLHVKGPEPDITAVIQDLQSDPVHPGDPITLQCSVFLNSPMKMCPGNRVLWFRAGWDESHPSVLYSNASRADECEPRPEAHSPHKCVYSFSRDQVSSSDSGTYYCAVATCGHIFFGSGTKLEIKASAWSFDECSPAKAIILLLLGALVLSQIVIIKLVYTIKKKKSASAQQTSPAKTTDDQQSQQRNEESMIYSMPNFTKGKACRAPRRRENAAEDFTTYTEVKVLWGTNPYTEDPDKLDNSRVIEDWNHRGAVSGTGRQK